MGLFLCLQVRLGIYVCLKRNICRVGRAAAKPTELTNDPVFSWHGAWNGAWNGAWHGVWCMVYGAWWVSLSLYPPYEFFIYISTEP